MHGFRFSLLSLALLLTAAGVSVAEELEVGSTAPEFELAGSDGETYTLSELLKDNEVVVVAWFPKAFTPGCTAECTSLREDGALLADYDVAYFTASCDTQEDNASFAEELELDYPILCDPSREAALAYGVVNDEEGWAARWTFYIGPDREILLIDKQIDTGEAASEVATNLEELGVGVSE